MKTGNPLPSLILPYIMSRIDLRGMGVALATPFRKDKSIDYPALERLIEHIVGHGADYLVVLGTTGETPTLFPEERDEIRRFVREKTGGRVPLVIGVGGNSTMAIANELRSIDLTGYEAVLSVVPFYNKPSQEGIYRHYQVIAEASPLPVILYNVPGRTGVNMEARTTLRIASDFDNVIGVKEASGNLTQIENIIRNKRPDFQVISGDDSITYPLMAMGAVGVISVVGNAYPREFGRMVRLCLEGRDQEAVIIHERFTELFSLLFVDGNPAGVKCALHSLGLIENELRLPLVPTCLETFEKIQAVLEDIGSVNE